MDDNEPADEKQERKRTAFTVMNAVRDLCKQPPAKKLVMLTLATYSDGDGICYPSNKKLADNVGTSERTIRRRLAELKSEGEIEVIGKGKGGRNQLRVIRLTRYAENVPSECTNPDTAVTGLTRSRSFR
jgi:predicted ArsR family transcriptional regulator